MDKSQTLEQLLSGKSVEGKLYEKLSDNRVHCFACGHHCKISPGKQGICKVRFNEQGILRVPRNYVSGLQIDPIEKKPFFHVLPGSRAFSFGMLGCDYHCDYCQNWITSQALRDPACETSGDFMRVQTAAELAEAALRHECRVITSTYNEPLITGEWAGEVFQLARSNGLLTSFVSNGNATREALEFLRPSLDLYKVDLKSMSDKTYRKHMGGPLLPVLETIERAKAMGFWVEIVTLVVPGLNDSEKELREIARFIASVSRDIPWHVTAFHPDYRMEDLPWTQPAQLNLAHEIGEKAGLNYVYSGNRPGEVGATENTYCPNCGELLVERFGFDVLENKMGPEGLCPWCSTPIAGVWKIPDREPNPVTPAADTPLAAKASTLLN